MDRGFTYPGEGSRKGYIKVARAHGIPRSMYCILYVDQSMRAAPHFTAATTVEKVAVKTIFCPSLPLVIASPVNRALNRSIGPSEHIRVAMHGAVWCNSPAQLTDSAYRFSQAVTKAGYEDHDVQ